MTLEVKKIKGHGLGTNMDWLCVVHQDEGFGFGDSRSITCIDMTVHAPEHDRPNVSISERMSYHNVRMFPHAYDSKEQTTFAQHIKENWDKIKSGETIDVDELIKSKG